LSQIDLNYVVYHLHSDLSNGVTNVDSVTKFKEYIEKAKEFLMCSSMKTSEIGYEVGYKDPHYFSYIFKKVQGCSPKEYRARGKE